MELTILNSVLIAAFVVGIGLFAVAWKRIRSWPRRFVVMSTICCAFYGGLPYILLKGGVLTGTPTLRFIASAFFAVFTLAGSFILNFTVERQRLRDRGHSDL